MKIPVNSLRCVEMNPLRHLLQLQAAPPEVPSRSSAPSRRSESCVCRRSASATYETSPTEERWDGMAVGLPRSAKVILPISKVMLCSMVVTSFKAEFYDKSWLYSIIR